MSRFVISPLDVIKIRLQVQLEPVSSLQSGPGKRPSHYTGFLNAFRTIAAEEGIRVRAGWQQQRGGRRCCQRGRQQQQYSTSTCCAFTQPAADAAAETDRRACGTARCPACC